MFQKEKKYLSDLLSGMLGFTSLCPPIKQSTSLVDTVYCLLILPSPDSLQYGRRLMVIQVLVGLQTPTSHLLGSNKLREPLSGGHPSPVALTFGSRGKFQVHAPSPAATKNKQSCGREATNPNNMNNQRLPFCLFSESLRYIGA